MDFLPAIMMVVEQKPAIILSLNYSLLRPPKVQAIGLIEVILI